jgi:hypothetical protein
MYQDILQSEARAHKVLMSEMTQRSFETTTAFFYNFLFKRVLGVLPPQISESLDITLTQEEEEEL